ncbi:MAG TPA: AMP-binding protein [Kofleriaceae bacterium]
MPRRSDPLDVDLDDLTSVTRRILSSCNDRPEALCFALRADGGWRSHTRGDLRAAIERYAALFRASLPSRSLVLFIKNLDAELLAAFLGAIEAGHVPGQLSPPSPKIAPAEYTRRVQHVLAATRAGAIFVDHCPPGLDVVPAPECERLFVRAGQPPFPEDATALVQFSSGSTGLQKGVLLSHRAILAHSRSYARALALGRDDTFVSWLPLYHDMGLMACYLLPLTCGLPFVQMSPFEWLAAPEVLFDAIEKFRGTITFLPNFAYHVLARKAKQRDLSSMRLFVNCSEPVSDRAHAVFGGAFSIDDARLSVSYAMAENTFAVSQRRPDHTYHPRSFGQKSVPSCGHVVAGTEICVVDADAEGIGELCIRGDYLFDRFLDGSRPLTEDGFYRTGDLGAVTDDGEVFVTGRKKDLVIINGKNIYPQDIEAICSEVRGVYPGRTVALGVENPATGSEDLVVIVERDGSASDATMRVEIITRVNGDFGIVPKKIVVVPHMTLVKTSSGKICRTRNRELLDPT